jgi:repressor LexA
MKGLTRRQEEILEYINASIQERGYPPTIREIGKQMGIRSTNGVNDHLKALERKGVLTRDDLKSRALRPVGQNDDVDFDDDGFVEVRLLGRVAAGAPILANEDSADTVKIDRLLIGPHREVFALRIVGESMIEAGIFDGDYVFVRKAPVAERGEIVIVMIGEEATCKYYYPEGDSIRFQPANAAMAPIYVHKRDFRETMIMGKVVGIYRKF